MTKIRKDSKSSPGQSGVFSERRRYLVNIDSISIHQLLTDCLIIGAGVAGPRATIEAAEPQKTKGPQESVEKKPNEPNDPNKG